MKKLSISVIDMALKFPKGNSGIRTIRDKFVKFFSRRKHSQDFIALREINFEALEGQVIGIIGRNGAGKSTLLRVIAGIYQPDEGMVKVRGKVSLLASVGVGFNRELTGRENVHLYGSILGLKKKLIEEKMQEIIAFSQLEDFIDSPIKTYSSGMKARLGFSVAANLEADILLIDEVFGVGDASFRERSKTKIFQMVKESNRTVMVVTHNSSILTQLCDRVLLIDDGRIIAQGGPDEMISAYEELISDGKGPSSRKRISEAMIGPAAVQRANLLIRRGQLKEAKILLNANLGSNQEENARYFLGQLAIESGDPSDAVQHWSYLDPEKIRDDRKLRRMGQYSKAIDLDLSFDIARVALLRNPDEGWAWQIIEACIRDSDFSNQLKSFPTTAPMIFSENPQRITKLGRLAFNLKRFDIAARFLNAVNTTSPTRESLDLEGRAWSRQKIHKSALICWKKLIDKNTNLEKNMDRAARAAFNSEYYLESAEIALQLHRLAPGKNQHIFLASRAITREEDSPLALTILSEVKDARNGSKEANLNKIKSLTELGSDEIAIQLVNEGLSVYPDDTDYNLIAGRSLMKIGDFDAAMHHLLKAQESEPDRADLAIYLARAYRTAGKLSNAVATLSKAREKHPGNLNLLLLLGNILSKAENWEGALDVWEKIHDLDPSRGNITTKIATCHMKLNRLDLAEKTLNEAMVVDNDDIKGLTILRQVYWKQSRHEDALEIFKRLLNLDINNTSLWKNIISLSSRLSRVQDVETYLERAEKHFHKSEKGNLELALIYENLHYELKMRDHIEEFISENKKNHQLLHQGAKKFFESDRPDVSMYLLTASLNANSSFAPSGLLMTKIFSKLELAGLNINWLMAMYENQERVSTTQLSVKYMLDGCQQPLWQGNPLDSVAFVANSIGIGGAERQIINTIRGFEKYISPVPRITLYCSEWDEKEDTESYRKFINEDIVKLKTIVPLSQKLLQGEEELIERFDEETIKQIPRNIRREIIGLYIQFKETEPSVVHAFHDRINIEVGIAALLAGVPRVVLSTRSISRHEVTGVNPNARPIWYKETYRELLKRPQIQMYHVSQAVEKTYTNWLNLEERQKLVIYNSTDYDLMRTRSSENEYNYEKSRTKIPIDAPVVGGIMRFSFEKRPLLFIDVASKVIELRPETHFVLLGDGPLMEQAKRKVRRLNMTKNIHLIGRSHQVYFWLKRFDLLMLTSEFEGLPNVLIEAQGFSVPVVSTNAGGASETFIDKETGYLVMNSNVESLSEKVLAIINDKNWKTNASNLSRENARKKFSIENAASNFVELYSTIDSHCTLEIMSKLPFEVDEGKTNLFIYVDDRNGRAGLLAASAKRKGINTHLVRSADQIPNHYSSFVYFYIDHLNNRERDKLMAEEFAKLDQIRMAPCIGELRVYDDKALQQIEYGVIMPPALYSSSKDEALAFLDKTTYPLVSKSKEGAHASNIRMINTKKEAADEVSEVFSEEGMDRFDVHNPGLKQKGYVLWQKFLPNNPNDWRLIMLGGKYAMVVHRQNRPDLPFASGSGLRTPENELNVFINGMLEWARMFVIEKRISVLAADVILDENKEYVLVETSTTWPPIMHEKNHVFKFEDDAWITSEYRGTDIFDLKADIIQNDEFHGW